MMMAGSEFDLAALDARHRLGLGDRGPRAQHLPIDGEQGLEALGEGCG